MQGLTEHEIDASADMGPGPHASDDMGADPDGWREVETLLGSVCRVHPGPSVLGRLVGPVVFQLLITFLTHPLSAQVTSNAPPRTWEVVLAESDSTMLGRVPELLPSANRMKCGSEYVFPDSLAVVSRSTTVVLAPSIWRWTNEAEWTRGLGANVPDTLRGAVVGYACARSQRFAPMGGLSEVFIRADGVVVSFERRSIRSSDRAARAIRFFEVFLIGSEGEVVEAQMVETEDPLQTGRSVFTLRPYDALAVEAAGQARRDSIAAARMARYDSVADARSRERARLAEERSQRIESMGNARGWDARTIRVVIARQVRIGMTAGMVRAAWGDPTRINRTETRLSIREQWAYGDGRYVYFERGTVVAIQT